MSIPALDEIRKLLPANAILTEKEDILPYSFDGTAALLKMPLAVVFPTTAEEIAQILKICVANKTLVVTRGSGTGLSGGSLPVDGCIVLCLVRMSKILEVDTKNLTLLAESGAVTQEIAARAEVAGLFYPPDPGSMKISTIGGNVAENSGGLRGLKYGVTRDYVMGLEVVFTNGDIAWMGNKCVKDVAGYNLRDLFIGSEGTLGVITKVLLKLIPKPQARKTLLAIFDQMEAASDTVSAIIEAKIIPCTLEFLDKVTINSVEDYAKIGLPRDAAAVLLIETDGHPASVEDEARAMESICMANNARLVKVAQTAEEAGTLATARRAAFSSLARVSPTTILEDATVPRSELTKMVSFIQKTAEKHKLRVGTFGHMGDGNLHPTFLTNERNHEEMHRVEIAMVEIFDFALSLGGTITGEHGVGLAKKPFLPKALGPVNMRLLKTLKTAFDPEGILNPGKIFD
ncbi:MAG TPA: FAD-linked oxidase C-terminal domain-containing protein [Candidatus Methylacidiphilales bacterium]|nr:FAD-linked oxidase C-terminal domain-containing protein [Candidatus Methylacidiphilales bacterium]